MEAMGLHRDGQKWNILPSTLDSRRRVFWEVWMADVFRSLFIGRPAAISLDHIDTEYPRDVETEVGGDVGFFTLKLRQAELFNESVNRMRRA
jgi:hypothetical protein